jgi:Restriction endonuclease
MQFAPQLRRLKPLSTLDFSKLAGTPPGETFQALIRLIGEQLKLGVSWTGRGADGGRDLIFVETQEGPIKGRPVRWLVSCKDNSDSKRSVTERDVGNVSDKVRQHDCDGFLLATTTTASAALKELLDKLDADARDPIQTKVWDRFYISQMLLSDRFSSLLMQFFPEHQRREAVAKLDAAREVVEAALPRFTAGRVREHLVRWEERYDLLSAVKVAPHHADQQALIDALRLTVLGSRVSVSEAQLYKLDIDAFVSFCDILIHNFPSRAMEFLKLVAEISIDDRVIYNAIEMLRESGDFSLKDELEITCRRDSDMLYALYFDQVHSILEDLPSWGEELLKPHAVDADHVADVDILGVTFSGGSKVSVTTDVIAWVHDDLDHFRSHRSLQLKFEANLDGYSHYLRLVITHPVKLSTSFVIFN